jgi:hypothetical protein
MAILRSVVVAAVVAPNEPVMPTCRDVFLPEATGAPAKLCLLITMQIFEVQLDPPSIVEIRCKVTSDACRRISAHTGDGTPNIERQTIDTFRIPGIVVRYLAAASECRWLIGEQEQQNSGHGWRTSYGTLPHASTPSRVEDLANAVAKQRLSGMPTNVSGNELSRVYVRRINLSDFLGRRRQF